VFKSNFEFITAYIPYTPNGNILHKIKKANQTGHKLGRNSFFKHVIEEKIKG
jgi:hypothetical protein